MTEQWITETIRGADAMMNAVNEAFKVARHTGIAGYAVETFDGWVVSERKPSLRFGRVLECHLDGKVIRA